MSKSVDMDQTIEFHIQLDKEQGGNSPNRGCPPFLVDYYNKKII